MCFGPFVCVILSSPALHLVHDLVYQVLLVSRLTKRCLALVIETGQDLFESIDIVMPDTVTQILVHGLADTVNESMEHTSKFSQVSCGAIYPVFSAGDWNVIRDGVADVQWRHSDSRQRALISFIEKPSGRSWMASTARCKQDHDIHTDHTNQFRLHLVCT